MENPIEVYFKVIGAVLLALVGLVFAFYVVPLCAYHFVGYFGAPTWLQSVFGIVGFLASGLGIFAALDHMRYMR